MHPGPFALLTLQPCLWTRRRRNQKIRAKHLPTVLPRVCGQHRLSEGGTAPLPAEALRGRRRAAGVSVARRVGGVPLRQPSGRRRAPKGASWKPAHHERRRAQRGRSEERGRGGPACRRRGAAYGGQGPPAGAYGGSREGRHQKRSSGPWHGSRGARGQAPSAACEGRGLRACASLRAEPLGSGRISCGTYPRQQPRCFCLDGTEALGGQRETQCCVRRRTGSAVTSVDRSSACGRRDAEQIVVVVHAGGECGSFIVCTDYTREVWGVVSLQWKQCTSAVWRQLCVLWMTTF
ncbi:unnamed protein product [Pneumocystis jirovecii]|uniref:Uncharacterized protein n=1 Tax=Pneumocystis jirovecii TaxID=42068 RepID=L0PD08_PNEJI|nr:unnamed protein product [Pneumocystis jirovecii]